MQHDLDMANNLSKRRFQEGTSTETALRKIMQNLAKKRYVLVTFLDIEGAFDNVSLKAIPDAINSLPSTNLPLDGL